MKGRRGGRVVEGGGLENRYPELSGSWVRIPPSPPSSFRLDALRRFVNSGFAKRPWSIIGGNAIPAARRRASEAARRHLFWSWRFHHSFSSLLEGGLISAIHRHLVLYRRLDRSVKGELLRSLTGKGLSVNLLAEPHQLHR